MRAGVEAEILKAQGLAALVGQARDQAGIARQVDRADVEPLARHIAVRRFGVLRPGGAGRQGGGHDGAGQPGGLRKTGKVLGGHGHRNGSPPRHDGGRA
ncbi:hypothetical protein AZA_45066 [Nitrospirillum viridazoti Y2]|nr:hypothetical protein AZA_45066 [Nitrospirillum amazonense Y2]